jgi:hypothetical protein
METLTPLVVTVRDGPTKGGRQPRALRLPPPTPDVISTTTLGLLEFVDVDVLQIVDGADTVYGPRRAAALQAA